MSPPFSGSFGSAKLKGFFHSTHMGIRNPGLGNLARSALQFLFFAAVRLSLSLSVSLFCPHCLFLFTQGHGSSLCYLNAKTSSTLVADLRPQHKNKRNSHKIANKTSLTCNMTCSANWQPLISSESMFNWQLWIFRVQVCRRTSTTQSNFALVVWQLSRCSDLNQVKSPP